MERIAVGISGASGAILGIRLLEVLSESNYETHLIISDSAEKTIEIETDWGVDKVRALADHVHDFSHPPQPGGVGDRLHQDRSACGDGMSVVVSNPH